MIPSTQAIFVAQLNAIFVALWVASSFKHVWEFGDIAATKAQVVYKRDFEVTTQNATKFACVNGAL